MIAALTTVRSTPPAVDTAADAGTDPGRLLTPAEVAALFRVDPKTVTRWAKAGRVSSIRTIGGHRRYPAGQFAHLLDPVGQPASGGAEGRL
jgi:excisionase family DNA binding protein